MIIRCSKCSTEFDLDPTQVGAEGVTLRCSVCSHMFHAEPNPLAGNREPWQLCNVENHLFSLPDLKTILEWIEDGRLRPDDQVSRTGRVWIRLGDIAELSTLFVGFDGLPRVFKAREAPASTPSISGIAPPPVFGEDLEEIPPFGVGNEPRAAQSGPMSMLDVVTKAVSGPPPSPRHVDDDAPTGRQNRRSEPILVSDLAAAGSAAASTTGRAEPTPSPVAEPSASEQTPTGRDTPATLEPSATSEPAEAAVVVQSVQNGEAAPARSGGGLGWLAILGVAAGLAVMLGVPDIRAKIFGGGDAVAGPGAPQTPLAAVVDADPVDLQQADQALFELGLAETGKAQATLQKLIDERQRRSDAVADLQLAQAELILSRALAFKVALIIEANAVDGSARSRAQEDEAWAADLIAEIAVDKVKDSARLGRVRALLSLVQGHNAQAAAEVPQGAPELALVVAAAPLWESTENPVPSGVISGIQALPRPSTLGRSILALALWRGGDTLGAMKVVMAIQQEVADQPLTNTLHKALTAALAEEQDAPEVTPPDPATEPTKTPEIKRPTAPSGGGSNDLGPAETRTQRGCDRVRSGDAAGGIKLLLAAIDANQVSLDTYLCLGDGYSRLGNHNSALAFYERALTQAPKHKAALEGGAQAAERVKRTSKATELYKRLLAVDPGNEGAQAYLGRSGGDSTPTPTPSTTGGGSPGTSAGTATPPSGDDGLLPVKGDAKPFSEGP